MLLAMDPQAIDNTNQFASHVSEHQDICLPAL
ncbi:hypothetical protein BRLA_c020620 [Brevibacillus laterosporus LMG 15441]|uniref:Uncharacterized protein n=1 Tax=Brevibacillus laterosporus LMG 15441 TaxID=1042163 RepID=A0A075R5D0_BRELA|nr:hypothetical protein BRLA_c020620 [Brevibacillus laterosporus LMG 15441]